ncbi:MAG: ABC transporter permease [Parcubacteria group bacterium]|nr:ABC transporter permease [Parcubacteria group bacterium]
MNPLSIIKQSLTALKANKLRSFFSILGIVIGVAAVVIILSMGQGLKGLVTSEIEAFGPNILDIAIKIPGADQMSTVISMVQGVKITTLKLKDVKALKDQDRFPYIKAVSGQSIAQEWATYGSEEKQVLIYGCSTDYPLVMKVAKIDQGRFFTQNEDDSLSKVVVLGSGLVEKLFKEENPLGKKIKIKGQNFKVIGTFKPQGGVIFGGIDINDFLYTPLQTTLKEVLGIDYLSEIVLDIEDSSYLPQAIEEISRMLRKHHNIKDPEKDDFQITTMKEILDQVNEISVILNLLLGFLAAISLLVGGIGIMNIMLVSVSERTREIGLRKSLGATRRDILWQFLIESLVITSLGGFIGAFLGIVNSLLVGLVIQSQGLNWPLAISWLAIVIAFLVSMAIGLIFGIYPARKAAKLNPIEALRKE